MDKKQHRLVCLFPTDTWVVQERMPSGDWMAVHNCTEKGREGYTEAKKWMEENL